MISTGLAALALALWVYLAFGRAFYWRARERLGNPSPPTAWPEVVAVIPARNEGESIGVVIAAHMASDYPGRFSIVLVDDGSDDDTAALAREAANASSRRLEIIEGAPLAPGWTGKLWAMQQGIERARVAAPEARYLLLTDADIVHAPSTLRRLVAKAENDDLALASLMARLDARGVWGSLLIPAFIYFFQQLYPFPLANNAKSRTAAAAGGCMLVKVDALEAVGGVAAIRGEIIDDCALAALLKSAGAPRRIWIGLAQTEVVSLRDNRRLSSIWDMVARTAYVQLRRSPVLLAAVIFGMGVLYLSPPALVFALPLHRNVAAFALAAMAYGLMAASYRPTLRLYGEPAWRAALLPLAGFFYALMTFSSAFRHWRGAGGRWKGRSYA
ncbi:MAG TPA: glycosyltransferase [Parvularculaceae bacterium]|nr:glycosyltransferase [Parvularculaceae bacterium]